MDDCEFHCDRDQAFLLPPSLLDWVPGDRVVWTILSSVEEMDLTEFYADYRADGHGLPSYDPSMMTRMRMGTGPRGESSVSEAQRAVRGRGSRGEPMNDRSRETVQRMRLLYVEGHEPRTTDPTGLRRRVVPGRTAHRRPTIGGSAETRIDPDRVEEMVWTDAEAQYNHDAEKLSNRPDVGMSAEWPRTLPDQLWRRSRTDCLL